jgi:hypothetical protein
MDGMCWNRCGKCREKQAAEAQRRGEEGCYLKGAPTEVKDSIEEKNSDPKVLIRNVEWRA